LYNPDNTGHKLGLIIGGIVAPWAALKKSEEGAQKLLDELGQAVDTVAVLGSEVKSCHSAMAALFSETRDDVRPAEVTADDIAEKLPQVPEKDRQFQAACHTAFNQGHSRMAQRLNAALGHVLRRLNDCRREPVVAALIPEVHVGRPGVAHQPIEELAKEGEGG
jgi:hypothetical protein